MSALTDDEVTGALTSVPGIELWSAQVFLVRQLRRPDVLPAGDTGIRRAIAREWNLTAPPAAPGPGPGSSLGAVPQLCGRLTVRDRRRNRADLAATCDPAPTRANSRPDFVLSFARRRH